MDDQYPASSTCPIQVKSMYTLGYLTARSDSVIGCPVDVICHVNTMAPVACSGLGIILAPTLEVDTQSKY